MQLYLTRKLSLAAWLFVALLIESSLFGMLAIDVQSAEFPPALNIIEGKTAQGFPYLFGGVSSNEREAMKERAKAKGYNVKLIFAEKRGPFVAGVTVVIMDNKGAEVVSVTGDGPWFYIQLPPASYRVKASFKGQTKEIKNLNLPKNRTLQQTFIWDIGEE